MSELDQFFAEISEEIAKDVNKKSLLQDFEHRFDLSIIPYQLEINTWVSVSPDKLHEVFRDTSSFEGDLERNLASFNQELTALECKSSQKERLSNKFIEDSIYILLANRYFWVLSTAYTNEDSINIDLVTSGNKYGIIATPKEINTVLKLDEMNYQLYLLSLLKLIDTIVDYTTTTVINQSIGHSNTPSANYTIGLINSQLVSKIQNGFSLLDLKNDLLRKKYDSLKYSCQRLNKIVYDLSLRNLITTTAELH
ncbi:tsn1 [Candida oxycetoniae]|uniref:Tsn1 n=1 Tax=Candida oxycetoniae TaxID=497107 RepID=A0AAI9STP7_9ASCO|nr:tsn1 [Candida oxycetoniae]KAI3402855.2 tsn1 [Candida oxycetoniae]